MKNNQGITIITLVITIVVMVLIASITIYSGLNTMDSVRKKNAVDTTNAIYLALTSNDDIIPSDNNPGKMLSECDFTSNEEISNEDFKLLGLKYSTDNCKVIFSKSLDDENRVTYVFSYTDEFGNTYNDLEYSYHKELGKTSSEAEFDNVKKVNRPVVSKDVMTPLNYSGENLTNVYTENWYNYEKGVSKLASMKLSDGNTYVWIPRFAYKIQNFYRGKTYQNIPTTSIDIVFLRDDSSYMPNGETLDIEYQLHPAFENGVTGFWVMANPYDTNENSIDSAVSAASNSEGGHLMKNSEYAAAVFLTRYLGNTEISFNSREFVAAGCDINDDNFDIYSSNTESINYIGNVRWLALTDTPWNLKKEPILPDDYNKYLLRNVSEGGEFYYEATSGSISASCRTVISK